MNQLNIIERMHHASCQQINWIWIKYDTSKWNILIILIQMVFKQKYNKNQAIIKIYMCLKIRQKYETIYLTSKSNSNMVPQYRMRIKLLSKCPCILYCQLCIEM